MPARKVAMASTRTTCGRLLSFAFMAFVALIPFFGIREFGKVIGEDRMNDLLFHRRAKVPLR